MSVWHARAHTVWAAKETENAGPGEPARVFTGATAWPERDRGGERNANISATLAEVASSSAPSVLAALTKGGLAAATRSLAVEYASRGIRVNAVSPGIIQTPVHPPESYDGLADQLPPLGRVGQVSDVVGGILFLESAPHITGEILHIDGGRTAGR